MSNAYILEGPAGCGSLWGYWKKNLIPERKFVIVEDGEYANGGYGPCLVASKVFTNRKEASDYLLTLNESEEISDEDLAAAADYFDNILWQDAQMRDSEYSTD